MSKFIIAEDFFDVFPNAKIGVILAKGVTNLGSSNEAILKELSEAHENCLQHLKADVFSENPAVDVWRKAYQKFKTKKGARCSIEALLKRVLGGNQIPSINPLVDIYNTVSLNYAIPCGGEDLDTFDGDMVLTKAIGDEMFLPLGSTENESPYIGEIVYRDNVGAICRCWNWREAQRTMLTEKTKNAFLIIEYMDDSRVDDLKDALESLASSVEKHLGGSFEKKIMDINCREMEL